MVTAAAPPGSGILVVAVEVDAQQEVLQVGLVAPVHQLCHHWEGRGRVSQRFRGALWPTQPVGTAHL